MVNWQFPTVYNSGTASTLRYKEINVRTTEWLEIKREMFTQGDLEQYLRLTTRGSVHEICALGGGCSSAWQSGTFGGCLTARSRTSLTQSRLLAPNHLPVFLIASNHLCLPP
ncbi:unnamed protein product [Pipistrellus nathusii]|uniref:Uncharacterized protein n=1 Tax=Pipistrellus nathusii TaxID=59473 RepID=A0ABP0ADC1_PIPNA